MSVFTGLIQSNFWGAYHIKLFLFFPDLYFSKKHIAFIHAEFRLQDTLYLHLTIYHLYMPEPEMNIQPRL